MFALIAAVVIPMTNGVSFAEAFAQVAAARAQDRKADIELVVAVKGKALAQPLVIDGALQPADAGWLTVRGEKGMRPRLLGSLPVKDWKRLGKKMNGRKDVWVADVSGRNLADQVDALFLDGKLMPMARYPNFDPKSPYAGGWAYVPGRWISMYATPKVEPAGSRTDMLVGAKDWHDWAVPTEGRIVIFPKQRYSSSYVRIADFDRAAKRLRFAGKLCSVPRPGDAYFLCGFREELDDFGEWCHDLKGGKLYFIPPKGKDPNKCLVTIPSADAIFQLDKAHHVSIENLEICAGRTAVDTKGCSFVSVRGCVIHDTVGRNAVAFEKGHDNELRDSDLFDLGFRAVHITGGGVTQPNTVENCYIHHVGKVNHAAAAIFMEGCGYRVRHNLFHDLPQWAVFHTGNHHELTDNRVHHFMTETDDGGAFYTCNANGNVGTVTARNWISDGYGIAKAAGIGPYKFYNNSHGLYFDAGPNSGFAYDNVIERVSGMGVKLNENHSQVISNNVFYCTGRAGLGPWSYAMNLSSAKPKGPDDCGKGVAYGNQLVRNIWYYPNCPKQIYVLIQGADCARNTFDYNWICVGKEAKAPKFRDGVTWEDDWKGKWGLDRHSVVASDLAFVAPKQGDFTPKNRHVMQQLGIRPLVMKGCGLYVNEYRPQLPKEAEGCADHPEWIKNPTDHVNPPADGK